MSENGDSLADLMVDTFETTVRTSFRMVELPLRLYAKMVKRCADAMESALKEFDSDE